MENREVDPILLYAINFLEYRTPSAKKMKQLIEHRCQDKGIEINTERSSRTYSHTISTAKMFVRMKKCLKEEGCCLSETDYQVLLRSGTLFYDCVGRLSKLDSRACSAVLKSCLQRWPDFDMGKEQLTAFVKNQTAGFRHEKHDTMTEVGAVPFLKRKGCQFVSSEVWLGRRKIDALGWEIGSNIIYGVDVKTTAKNFGETKDRQLKEYLQVCDKLYILTSSQTVVEAVHKWNKRKNAGLGILVYSKETGEVAVLLEAACQTGHEQWRKEDAQARVYRKCVNELADKALAEYSKTGEAEWVLKWAFCDESD